MIDSKDTSTIPAAEAPTYIVTSACDQDEAPKRSGKTKRHVLYAVSAVVVIAVVLVAILVGVYMFTESQKEITKFALQFKGSNNENFNEEVESDPNDNVVQYHVTKEGQDVYIVNDFNRGMKVVKITEDGESECYVTALNRSAVDDPSVITGPDSLTTKETKDVYTRLADPVVDHSFMTKKARDLCKGVPLYWIVKRCDTETETDVKDGRVKRASCQTCGGWRVCSDRCRVTYSRTSSTCHFYVKC